MRNDTSAYYEFLTEHQKQLLENYLVKKFSDQNKPNRFNVVFDLLHQCDINCIGCGTDAVCIRNTTSISNPNLSCELVENILLKIKKFSEAEKKKVFINFGGGEPFLRKDIIKIITKAYELFGSQSIGIDTNASLPESYDLIRQISPMVSYIGISINGLHDYHNWWANNNAIDAYNRAMKVVAELCKNEVFSNKLEVTSVATTKNITTLTVLMDELAKIGVKNYSVHRAIPVGRMQKMKADLIPDWKQYLKLMVDMIETAEKNGLNAHIHHSIEAIHGTLLCGLNTIVEEKMIDKNYRSSIGIEPNGEIVIDPWCTVGYWKKLSLGNILKDKRSISEILHDNQEKNDLIRKCYDSKYRCRGCDEKCTGGNRIVAASTHLRNRNSQIEIEEIFQALCEIDPACPRRLELL